MLNIQLAILAVLLVSIVLRARGPGAGEWIRDAALIFVAAWIGEESCIHLYDFYQYAPGWIGWLDRVPVLIPIIWVFVVLSARDVARFLAPAKVLPLAFLLVWYDALLIEPVATHAGLWVWKYPQPKPGPFFVPLVAPLGWAFFAAAALGCLSVLKGRKRLLTLVIAPLLTHVMLLASWWGALRWIGPGPGDLVWTVLLGAVAIAATAWLAVKGKLGTVPLWIMAPRILPAAFFFVLLLITRRDMVLWAYACSFALPWVAASGWSWDGKTATAKAAS